MKPWRWTVGPLLVAVAATIAVGLWRDAFPLDQHEVLARAGILAAGVVFVAGVGAMIPWRRCYSPLRSAVRTAARLRLRSPFWFVPARPRDHGTRAVLPAAPAEDVPDSEKEGDCDDPSEEVPISVHWAPRQRPGKVLSVELRNAEDTPLKEAIVEVVEAWWWQPAGDEPGQHGRWVKDRHPARSVLNRSAPIDPYGLAGTGAYRECVRLDENGHWTLRSYSQQGGSTNTSMPRRTPGHWALVFRIRVGKTRVHSFLLFEFGTDLSCEERRLQGFPAPALPS